MREIKFRAWEISKNKYINDYTCHSLFEYFGFWSNNGFVYEQYTGLKDKNGREIYEGDICRYSIDDGISAPIEFNNGAFWFGALMLGIEVLDEDGIEIIGNIHENKELLD